MRYLGILWCLPSTLVGLFCLLLGRCEYLHRTPCGWAWRVTNGTWLHRWMVGGGWGGLVKGGVIAFACGPVVVLRDVVLNSTQGRRDQVLCHEDRHVAQGYVLGPFHGPSYLLASAVAWARGQNPYRDNWFERDARRHAGEPV